MREEMIKVIVHGILLEEVRETVLKHFYIKKMSLYFLFLKNDLKFYSACDICEYMSSRCIGSLCDGNNSSRDTKCL